MENLKKCTVCGQEFPCTNEYFAKEKRSLTGLRSMCKACQKEYNKKHYVMYSKEYYSENKEKIISNQKKYYAKNKESYKEYYLRNRVNQDKDKINAYQREYRKTDKAKKANVIKFHRRESIKRSLPSNYSKNDWEHCLKIFNYSCAYCGKQNDKLQQEHFIPVSRQGEYTVNNILPSCRSCNSSKAGKNFFEWYPTQQMYSKKRENKILKYLEYTNQTTQQLAFIK